MPIGFLFLNLSNVDLLSYFAVFFLYLGVFMASYLLYASMTMLV